MAGSIRFARTNLLEAAAAYLLNGPAAVLGVVCQWTNGSASVTRAAGSFIADGVKRWSLVSGNLATRFPANVRVSAMAADGLSITLSSAATAGGSGTDSGTFTPNAPLDEAAGYPMLNVMNGKRYVGWKSAAVPASPVTLEFDLGSSKTAAMVTMLAHDSGAIGSSNGAVIFGVDYATTYSGAAPTWTSLGTKFLLGARDSMLEFSPTAARFWRVSVTPGSVSGVAVQFGFGGIWLGAFDQDMGTFGNPGSNRRRTKQRARLEAGGRAVSFIRTGFDSFLFTPKFFPLADADYSGLENSFTSDRGVLLIDHRDSPFEVEWVDDAIEWEPMFTGLSSCSPGFRSLP